MWMPNPTQVARIHAEIIHLFAGGDDPISPPGIKDQGLLESGCSRPHTSLGDVEKYPTVAAKIAALFHSLAKNHAFHNGNKRTALVALLTTLQRNDLRLRSEITDDDIHELVLAVADDAFPSREAAASTDRIVEALADWIRKNTESVVHRLSSMRTTEFTGKCVQAGAKVRLGPGGVYLISKGQKSIKISGSTRELSRSVMTRYLRILGLNASAAGFDGSDFRDGVNPEREQIYRFMRTLVRLAKT